MSTRIFKYPLKIEDEQIIKMPLGYRILTVQVKDNVPCLWVLVDDEEKHIISCEIKTVGTGCSLDVNPWWYIGTYQLNQLVFHVFEYKPF